MDYINKLRRNLPTKRSRKIGIGYHKPNGTKSFCIKII